MSRLTSVILFVVGSLILLPFAFGQEENKIKLKRTGSTKDDEKPKLVFKRRDTSSDEDLRKQLVKAPEVGLNQNGVTDLLVSLRNGNAPSDLGPKYYAKWAQKVSKRPEMNALPWRKGEDCLLGKEPAQGLHVYSVNLRTCMREAVPLNDVRPDPDNLKVLLTKSPPQPKTKDKGIGGAKPLQWDKADAVPTLAQMLQTENAALRLLMIEFLSKIEGKESAVVLAQRAVFDLSGEVREKAVASLANRPRKDYQQTLLDGLRWPWRPAADHAAEALAALRLKDAVPELVAMLKEPDPQLPFTKDTKSDKGTYVREVVRINHLTNCLLCHAPSMKKEDLVRGRIPIPGEEAPPLYYAETSGSFVRADITYLRQDFSVIQPVANPGKWPAFQRFDYLLRTRKATTKEIAQLKALQKSEKLSEPYPQRDAVLFALREITQTDLGTTTENWLPLLLRPLQNPAPSSEEKK